MELCEVAEAHAGNRGEGQVRKSTERLDVCDPRAPGRVHFRLQLFPATLVLGEPVAVEPLEITVDALLAHDLLDPVDRRPVALRGDPGAFGPVHLLDFRVEVIEGPGQMRGRPAGLTSGNGAVIEDDHSSSRLG